MATIKLQPRPKIPPIGFFEPISLKPEDWMTDIEFLLGMLKKLNEVIVQTNKNTTFIDEYTGKIEELEAEMQELRDEMEEFEGKINAEIAQSFNEIRLELQNMINTTLVQANAYTDSRFAILENEISEITLGDISVYDPTTGMLAPLQTVLDNIYGSSREDAITASEYDALDMTATTYDALQITAFNYDKYGKSLLADASV